MIAMQKITPFLWFNTNAEEAMDHYVKIFKNARIVRVQRWGPHGAGDGRNDADEQVRHRQTAPRVPRAIAGAADGKAVAMCGVLTIMNYP